MFRRCALLPATRLTQRFHDDGPDVAQAVAIDERIQTRVEEKDGHGVLYDATERHAQAQSTLSDDGGDVRHVADQKQAVDPQHARGRLPEHGKSGARACSLSVGLSSLESQSAIELGIRGCSDHYTSERDEEEQGAVNLRADVVHSGEHGGEHPNHGNDHCSPPHRHDVAVAAVVTESDEAVHPDGRHRSERHAAEHRSAEQVGGQTETTDGGESLHFGHQEDDEQRLGEQAHRQVREHQAAQQQLGRRVQRLGRTDGVENQHVCHGCDDGQRRVDGRVQNVRNGAAVDQVEVDVFKQVAYSSARLLQIGHRAL